MALFDPSMFDQQAHQGGLLSRLFGPSGVGPQLPQSAGFPGPLPQQVGPTFANGQNGAMGGVPFQIAGGQPQPQSPTIDMSARSATPPAPLTAAPPATSGPLQAQTQDPSLSDRLSAFAHNPAGAQGLIPKLLDAFTGLSTGVRTDPQGIAMQQLNATYQALKQSGVPDATARAAALNPEILKTVAGAYFDTAPKLQETGTDPLSGQKSFAVYKPNQGTLTSVSPQGQAGQGQPATIQNIFDSLEQGRNAGKSQSELLAMLPNTIRDATASVIAGKSVPANYSMRGQARDMMLRFAKAIDPSFDETLIPQRQAFARGMASTSPSSPGGQKVLLNTALGHLGEAADAAVDLGNTNGALPSYLPGSAALAHLQNNISNSSTAQAGKVNKLSDIAQKLSGEVGKLYSGSSGGGEAERQATAERLSAAKTPEELAGALEASKNLIYSRLDALRAQRDAVYGSTGENIIDFLDPHTKQALDKIDTAIARLRSGRAAAPASGGLPKGWTVKVQ